MAWAALTVGLLEMALGRPDAARKHLTKANEFGGQFGNKWLEPVALTQLASLAARAVNSRRLGRGWWNAWTRAMTTS